jgi:hypothetical protein
MNAIQKYVSHLFCVRIFVYIHINNGTTLYLTSETCFCVRISTTNTMAVFNLIYATGSLAVQQIHSVTTTPSCRQQVLLHIMSYDASVLKLQSISILCVASEHQVRFDLITNSLQCKNAVSY